MRKTIKLIITILMTLLILLIANNCVKAASTKISAKPTTNVEVGDTITVTAKVTAAQWDLSIKVNGKVIASSSELDNYKSNITRSFSGTYKATEKGTVTFSLEGDVTDFDQTNTSINKTATVTVEPKSTSPTFTSKNETVYATDDGINVRSSYSTSSSVLGSLNKGDSVTRTGIATKYIDGILWSKVTYNGKTAYISSSLLTTTKPVVVKEEEDKKDEDNKEDKEDEEDKKSDNVNLKSLEVTPTGLSPAFSNLTTEYTMTVGSDIDKIEVKAVTEDENAKVSISGNKDLEIGDNKISIKVTAEDKTEKTYVITVTREEKEQLKLSELLIEGLPLDPEFDENVYEYSLTLDRSDVSELNITATPNEKNAEIEIVGNTDLKPGENVITILVKSSDGEEITTYQITAKLPEAVKDIVIIEKSNDLYKYIGIGIAVLALIIIIVVVIKKSRKSNEDEYYDDYSDLYNRRKRESVDNDTNWAENNDEVKLEDLPELTDEDLPKSLKKEKVEVEEKIEEKLDEGISQENVERIKKIDELYSMSGNETPRRRGKHF